MHAGYLALVIVDCAVYEEGSRRAGEVPLSAASEACRRDGAFAWLGMVEPTEEEFDAVRREFELHELAVEDAVNAHQRPKLELYGDTLFMVLKTLRFEREACETDVETGEIMVFVNEAFVITVRHAGERAARRAAAAREAARPAASRDRRRAARDHRPRGR
jgi:magnesium transporter